MSIDFARNTQLLVDAVHAKDAAEVERLIPLSHSMRNPHISRALLHAIATNDVACATLLAPAAEFMETTQGFPIGISVEMLQAVLPWCETDDRHNYFLSLIEHAEIGTIRAVAPCCDCMYKNSFALQMAVVHHRDDVVDLLYPLSNGPLAMEDLKKVGYPDKIFHRLQEHIDAEQLRTTLLQEISESTHSSVARKM